MNLDLFRKYHHFYILSSSNGHQWMLFSRKKITERKINDIASKYRVPSNIYLDEIEEHLNREGIECLLREPDFLTVL